MRAHPKKFLKSIPSHMGTSKFEVRYLGFEGIDLGTRIILQEILCVHLIPKSDRTRLQGMQLKLGITLQSTREKGESKNTRAIDLLILG